MAPEHEPIRVQWFSRNSAPVLKDHKWRVPEEASCRWQLPGTHQDAGDEQAMKYIGGVITISSWCRFPFYETDFGWGKPTWFGTAMGLNNLVIFIDSKDGEGIEALVTLSKEYMAKFERNPGIVKYATFFSAHT